MVAGASDDIKTLWYVVDTIKRNNPEVIALAAQIPLTSDQLDDLFRAGAAT
jgi:hypothetical protein